MCTELQHQKELLRASLRRRLNSVSAEERAERSQRIVQWILELSAWRQASRVLLFAPLPVEPNLDLLWYAGASADKHVAYPRVHEAQMRLYYVKKLDELERTRWGLREPLPDTCQEAMLHEIDVVLVPGLAFDHVGGRLGRGGGFYDRLLSQRDPAKTLLIGVCFAWQRIAEPLPMAAHDVRMDEICTD